MSNEMLEWVTAYLQQDEEIIVPVKKMWNEWHTTHTDPSLEAFTRDVLADERVEQMRGMDHAQGMEGMSPEEMDEFRSEMEELGYFSGPRVKLKSREITLEHIVKMITKHNDRMEAALQDARRSMPDDISETEEGGLIDLIDKVEGFRQELRDLRLENEEDGEEPPKE
jgi:hypothetical protein